MPKHNEALYDILNLDATGNGKGYLYQYFNQQGAYGLYIIASVTIFNWDPFDWACYFGASTQGHEAGFDEVKSYGCKMVEGVARAAFPMLEDVRYRP